MSSNFQYSAFKKKQQKKNKKTWTFFFSFVLNLDIYIWKKNYIKV